MKTGRDWIPRGRSIGEGQTVPRIESLTVHMEQVLNTRTGEILSHDDGSPIWWRWWAVSVTLEGRCSSCGRRDGLHWQGCPVISHGV